MPGDLLSDTVAEKDIVLGPKVQRPPMSVPPKVPYLKLFLCFCFAYGKVQFQNDLHRAAALLRSSRRPLVIVGKGAAYARAEAPVRRLVRRANLPFLPTPMGKGVVPDGDRGSVASARTAALKGADVVLLLGARLNWMMHFGRCGLS